MKLCKKCDEEKSLDEFHKNKNGKDGLNSRCKTCAIAATKAWNKANPERNRARVAKWQLENPDKDRARHIKWKKENPEKLAGYRKNYREANPEKVVEYYKKYKKAKPEKIKARNAVGNAIAAGKLIRPDACSVCLEIKNIEGHHEDYSKPFELIWVCVQCHGNIHHI